ncbi:Nif3-like dinuclear metal center hexameric protein [Thiohalobacter thiocyanaticus]|uniref:GTP cyclohydrolase 1 type 2 homolog n=1 Tax=Thiohalobacter thiocyanaticus TaxID=585455 RepID=A0A426QN86_9GAMM|nr:Nif3-like dinuclear metal center hexameric protein [Thiohalobacter thiocyanaticus]RRQ23136.1 Nif3-like dinuclear metal center hexameric protein [Thiohalobacter thiocyanaticus]
MATIDELVSYTDSLLRAGEFQDYCPNGLQVEGRGEVRRIVSGVTASQALVDAAIEAGADVLLVHHGYFWKGEPAPIVGMKHRRLKALLEHGINLLAYHLPLDAHPELGNNARLAVDLDLSIEGWFGGGRGPDIACQGRPAQPLTPAELADRLEARLGRTPLHLPGRAGRIERLAWCTGAAQSYIEAAAALGVDAFISGEASEQTTHLARELGIHYFGAGHHATERGGPRALGAHLAEKFSLEHRFIDIDNPV